MLLPWKQHGYMHVIASEMELDENDEGKGKPLSLFDAVLPTEEAELRAEQWVQKSRDAGFEVYIRKQVISIRKP